MRNTLLLRLSILVLLSASAAFAQPPTSSDQNFVVSLLASGLSGPTGGAVFRPPTGDIVVTEFGGNRVTLVNAASGTASPFATLGQPNWLAVRPSDGLVAALSDFDGPIVFYDSLGNVQGSITEGFGGCITGLAFDSGGNFYVADGTGSGESCSATGWQIDEFPGPSPWNSTASTIVTDLEFPNGLAFSPTPGPSGSLYAISQVNGELYQVTLGVNPAATIIATAPDAPAAEPVGVALDPLTGDIYVTRFTFDSTNIVGWDVLKLPAGATIFNATPFATGFNYPMGLCFDSGGNLYVNEFGTGDIWKFTRQSYTTGLQQVPPTSTGGTIDVSYGTVIPHQTITFPQGTDYGPPGTTTASIAVDFQQWNPIVFDTQRLTGAPPNTWSVVGTAVPSGTMCTVLSGTGGNCVVIEYLCYDSNKAQIQPCDISAPDGSLIGLTSQYETPSSQPNPLLAIAGDGENDWANITTSFTPDDPVLGGGTKRLNSDLFIGDSPPNINITTPQPNAVYSLNQAVAASYTCTDPQPQPTGYPTCTGPVANGSNINTASVGSKTFQVTSTDVINTTGTASVTYTVTFRFLGFFSPVGNPPVINVIKAGSAVPLKWRALDAKGIGITGLTLAPPPGTVVISAKQCSSSVCSSKRAVFNSISPPSAAGSSGLQDLGGGYYQFNWKNTAKGCWDVVVNPGDGTQNHAYFQAK